jgi:photosystem II stability/assembly factor-like uncharacterized protein
MTPVPGNFARRITVAILLLAVLAGCETGWMDRHSAFRLPEGSQWKKLDTPAYRGKQDDIFFIDPQTGWYVNGAGKIHKTVDGGNSWQVKLSQPGTYFRTIGFIDALHGFAGNIGPDYFPGVSDATPLYVTADGGDSWQVAQDIDGPAVKGLCAIDILRVPFINAGHLDQRLIVHAVGRVGGPAFLMRSLDGGKRWRSMNLGAFAGMILDVKFFDESTGFVFAATDAGVAQSHALILMTRDGGNTWTRQYQSTRPFELIWKASFPTRDVGYATLQSYNPDKVQSQRYVVKTTDGGLTWSEIPLIDDHAVRTFGVGFATPDIGWVGALEGGYQTTDGGLHWNPVAMGRAVNKIRLLPNNGGFTGYAIGTDVYKIEAFPAK